MITQHIDNNNNKKLLPQQKVNKTLTSFSSKPLLTATILIILVVYAVSVNLPMMMVNVSSPAFAVTTTDTSDGTNTTNSTVTNESSSTTAATALTKPPSLEKEHEEIHKTLDTIVESSGNTAAAAKQVRTLMQPHFEKEEQLSIPVLGALRPYAEGTLTAEAENQTIEIANMFKKEYKNMLNEHAQIVVALDNLSKIASMENRQDALVFIEQLKGHAMNEEQVTYPATIVVGDLLQLKK